MKREIKKSVIVPVESQGINKSDLEGRMGRETEKSHSKERSRERNKQQKIKEAEVEEVNAASRRELLRRMREREEQEEFTCLDAEPVKKVLPSDVPAFKTQPNPDFKARKVEQIKQQAPVPPEQEIEQQSQEEQQQEGETVVLHKPVYVGKQERQTLRNQSMLQQKLIQEQSRKMKIERSNAKLLLNETLKTQLEEDIEGEDSDKIDMPDDDDTKDEALEYQLWKIRELKRIRRDNEERNSLAIKEADIERRRKMTDQERLLENKRLGSDLTDKTETTKYVYMQKYYHRGAFFQDSEEAVMKKDYNLPTAMELQDKTMLPKILQKRKNDFGKKGQSKHTHLVDVDTTNFDPRTKANESVMISLQKKMAGYKDSFLQGKR